MNHAKAYHSMTVDTSIGLITLEGPLTSTQLNNYLFHEGLKAFRPSTQQLEALQSIADLPEGRILVAIHEGMIIGYVTFLHPDPLERWSKFQMNDLLELGAIEIAKEYRSNKIGSHLLKLAIKDPIIENYIIISTEYYWHWDLKETKLSVWNYRKIMEKMMAAGGLYPAPTDDPEIISHPANCLMVRIGKHVPESSVKRFDQLRFLERERHRSYRKGY